MKKNTATWCIGLIAAVTLAMTFIQPTVIHQLVVWVSGLFAVVVTLALFVAGNWPQPAAAEQNNGDTAKIELVKYLRARGMPDATIAANTGIDIDVVGAIR